MIKVLEGLMGQICRFVSSCFVIILNDNKRKQT